MPVAMPAPGRRQLVNIAVEKLGRWLSAMEMQVSEFARVSGIPQRTLSRLLEFRDPQKLRSKGIRGALKTMRLIYERIRLPAEIEKCFSNALQYAEQFRKTI